MWQNFHLSYWLAKTNGSICKFLVTKFIIEDWILIHCCFILHWMICAWNVVIVSNSSIFVEFNASSSFTHFGIYVCVFLFVCFNQWCSKQVDFISKAFHKLLNNIPLITTHIFHMYIILAYATNTLIHILSFKTLWGNEELLAHSFSTIIY